MHRTFVNCSALCTVLLLLPTIALAAFPVTFGTSWDGVSLQEILDAEYGVGVIDAATGYEGYLPGDADPAYWEDLGVDGLIVREVAGYSNQNVFGWYEETLAGMPVIDGNDDGVLFTGSMGPGTTVTFSFPNGVTRFGFYLNPNGPLDSGTYAPEPEMFFTNRFYHDLGPDGSGSPHAPFDGDPQCLVYNVSHLYGGVPTFVLAWEDLDAGSPISATWNPSRTDNDYQDLVIEIQALSPVRAQASSWSGVKSLFD